MSNLKIHHIGYLVKKMEQAKKTFESLGPKSELEIFEYFQKMTEGKTCIYATHRLGIARQADRIIVLSNGKIAEMGTHEELVGQNGIYAKMYHVQSEWYVNGGNNACII